MNTKTLSRLFGALVAMMLLSVSFTLTSCGDDEEDDGGGGGGGSTSTAVKINGKSYTVETVETQIYDNGVFYVYLYYTDEEGVLHCIDLDSSNLFVGKTYKLTDDLSSYDEDGNLFAWTGIYFDCYNAETDKFEYYYGYWTHGTYYDDELETTVTDPNYFESGTMFVDFDGDEIILKLKGKTINKLCGDDGELGYHQYTFDINYKGSYSLMEEEEGPSEGEGPSVKAEFPMQKVKGNKIKD